MSLPVDDGEGDEVSHPVLLLLAEHEDAVLRLRLELDLQTELVLDLLQRLQLDVGRQGPLPPERGDLVEQLFV